MRTWVVICLLVGDLFMEITSGTKHFSLAPGMGLTGKGIVGQGDQKAARRIGRFNLEKAVVFVVGEFKNDLTLKDCLVRAKSLKRSVSIEGPSPCTGRSF